MDRANSVFLIPVPFTLPLFLLTNSTGDSEEYFVVQVDTAITNTHITRNPLKFTEEVEQKGKKRLLVPFFVDS